MVPNALGGKLASVLQKIRSPPGFHYSHMMRGKSTAFNSGPWAQLMAEVGGPEG